MSSPIPMRKPLLDTINLLRFIEATGYEPYISGLQNEKPIKELNRFFAYFT